MTKNKTHLPRVRRREVGPVEGIPSDSMLPLWRRIYQEFRIRSERWGLPSNTNLALMHLYIHPEESEPAAMAEAIYIPRQTATFILDTLEREGLASRLPHPKDRRRKRVQLTPKGKQLAQKMVQDLLMFETDALKVIDPSQVDSFRAALDRYANALAAANDRDNPSSKPDTGRASPLTTLIVFGLLSLSFLTGCTRFDPARARQAHTDSFQSNLMQRAEAELTKPLSLEDCIRIAMTNNYQVRKADLDRELYRIGKQVAFTAFLPTVAASGGYNVHRKDPLMAEKKFGTGEINVTLPIFMPSSWFLYAATRQGYAAAGVAAHYVRQGIVLQTSVNYFNVLVQQDTIAALETQLEAARETAARVSGLADEGLVSYWEGDQARFAAEMRETELNHARRQLAVLRSELLQGLGLPANAPIELSGETGNARLPEESLEDLVLKALSIHPELAIADRQVVIEDHQVRQAFCNFLPVISLFSTGSWTGNDVAVHAENWVSGFHGVWTLFDGMANVARYKAAKVERRQSELERENTFLSVIVGVVAAEAAARDAIEAAHVRKRAYEVSSAKWADYDAKAREGLLPLSDALDARAAMDLVQVALVQSQYQERIAIANLELAMGITLVPNHSTETNTEESP